VYDKQKWSAIICIHNRVNSKNPSASNVFNVVRNQQSFTKRTQNQGIYISVIFIKFTGSVAAAMSLRAVQTTGTFAGAGFSDWFSACTYTTISNACLTEAVRDDEPLRARVCKRAYRAV
jgi:hypothetical protein